MNDIPDQIAYIVVHRIHTTIISQNRAIIGPVFQLLIFGWLTSFQVSFIHVWSLVLGILQKLLSVYFLILITIYNLILLKPEESRVFIS